MSVRLSEPRIPPLSFSEWNEELREIWRRGNQDKDESIPNIMKTLANHPNLLKRWRVFGNHVLFKSTLPPRDREILILRIGWLCRSEYEWAQHIVIGKQCKLTEEEIRGIIKGPDALEWDSFDATLLRAVDELYIDSFISNDTWNSLSERYTTQQLMDVIFTVGEYNLVSMALNTLGVQLEEGLEGFPK